MEILAYGEDGLTLWALKNKLDEILKQLGDDTDATKCKIFYRPSFGRGGRGGENSSKFGEFDFIILSRKQLYLGESKWGKPPKRLDDVQTQRHEIFKSYVEQWFKDQWSNWADFINKAEDIKKPLAPVGSILASNIKTVLEEIRKMQYDPPLKVINVLLYLYKGKASVRLPENVNGKFKPVSIGYSNDTFHNFIKIEI